MRQSPKDKKVKERRARSNLKKFDIDQIKAELESIESESLRIDPSAKINKSSVNKTVSEQNSIHQPPLSESPIHRSPVPDNTMAMQPDNSRLLHKALRTNRTKKQRHDSPAPANKDSRFNKKSKSLKSKLPAVLPKKLEQGERNSQNKVANIERAQIVNAEPMVKSTQKTFNRPATQNTPVAAALKKQQKIVRPKASSGPKSMDFKKPDSIQNNLGSSDSPQKHKTSSKKIDGFTKPKIKPVSPPPLTPTPVPEVKKKDKYPSPKPLPRRNIESIKPDDVDEIGSKALGYSSKFHNHTKKFSADINMELVKSRLFANSMQLAGDAGLLVVDEHDMSVVPAKMLVNNEGSPYNHKKHKRSLAKINKNTQRVIKKPRHTMIGGVQHYNTDKSRLQRALSYKSAKIIAVFIISFLIFTFLLVLNRQNINLRIAENRSGIELTLPGYTPDGFSLQNNVESETGKVAFNFTSSDKSYTITQSPSDWDSTALLNNKVSKESDNYSTYTDRGLTIYIYDGKAVWVNQGKVNEIISTPDDIDNEDLIRIAGSM